MRNVVYEASGSSRSSWDCFSSEASFFVCLHHRGFLLSDISQRNRSLRPARHSDVFDAGVHYRSRTRLQAQRAELQKIIQRKVLANGLEIIVVENHGVPLVTIEADVKNGSFTQSPEYEGLAHMYEHMFFRANKTYSEPESFVDRAGDLGAVFNGTTEVERVNYYLTVSADNVEGGLSFWQQR